MKIGRFATLFLILFIAGAVAAPLLWYTAPWEPTGKLKKEIGEEDDPDLPPGVKIDKGEYLRLRNEQLFYLRGYDTAKQESRSDAIHEMERAERDLGAARARSEIAPEAQAWKPLGPAPLPVSPGSSNTYSGRVSSIAVDPTDPNIVYVGTAQGGLYRSLNGGTSWTPLLDNALSLAIGAIAIAPSDHTLVFVGTGEPEFSADSFFGVGVYRIANANTSPVVSGPLNKNASSADIFTGRAISEIQVHPTDPNILFVTSASGTAGIGGGTTGLTLPNAGVYRTTNAMDANPVFTQLTVQGTLGASRSAIDSVMEPGNPAHLIVGIVGSGGDGGIYDCVNALDPTPTFTRRVTTGDGSTAGRAELAIQKTGAVVTVYAATGTSNGTVFKSVDGGASFSPLTGGVGFCNPQCFYDMAIAVDPNDANKVYLGGSPARVFGRSIDGGTSYTNSSANLHVDTQAFGLAPSNTNIMYFGSDGGIWKTNDVSATPIVWTTLNNSTFSATQFQGIALHPTNRNYLLGGTQDNGTEFLAPDGTDWIRSDGGDGGFAVIDQNATDTTNVIAYHTYFNQTGSQIGFSRALSTVPPGDPNWGSLLGCSGGTSNNGIICADATLFYAPMVGGPNAPGSTGNTLYFGSSRLYRSINQGTTMTDVSGILPGVNTRISAIGIAPQNDDIRLVGTTNGTLFLSTTAGATTMTDVTGLVSPPRYIGRVAIDPTNSNVAYVTLTGFGVTSGAHVWKTTNLLSGTPTWSMAGSGIPDVPVSAIVIDPANTQTLYAGTDIGVFQTTNGGASWVPFSSGLPRVAVFGIAIQPTSGVLRIATHGRGIYEYDFRAGRPVFDFDGDGKTDVGIYRPTPAEWWIQRSSNNSILAAQFGATNDVVSPGDFTGDGKTDIAFFRPSTGQWFVLRSEDSSFYGFPFGSNGDIPAPADYDGDGKTDPAVYRPVGASWFILRSSDGGVTSAAFGVNGDKPVPADYDGDGKADIGIYRPNGGTGGEWWIQRSTAGLFAATFGNNADKTVQGDWTGDGKADCAFFRPSNNTWYVLRSEDQSFFGFPFGVSTDTPAPGDYDGDGKFDAAVFRQPGAQWFINRSTGGVTSLAFGVAGDQPIPGAYVR